MDSMVLQGRKTVLFAYSLSPRPHSTGTSSPHSSWYQNNVLWYIVSSAELTQDKGTKVIEELQREEEFIALRKVEETDGQ